MCARKAPKNAIDNIQYIKYSPKCNQSGIATSSVQPQKRYTSTADIAGWPLF